MIDLSDVCPIRDPLGFTILVDAASGDPITRLLLARRSLKGRARSLLSRLGWLRPDGLDQLMHRSLLARLLRPGDRLLDLGAQIGLVSLAAAALGCEVAAVEACPKNAALLRASARRPSPARSHCRR